MNFDDLVMNLLAWLFPSYQARLVEQAGGEVARQCRTALWQRISWRIRGMSVAEVRGYVRACAAEIVASDVEQVLSRRRWNLALREQVTAASVDQLVSLAVRDVLSEVPPVAAKPRAA